MNFYLNEKTGEILFVLGENGICIENIKEIKAGAVDAAKEKHIPVINVNNNDVEVVVGSVLHPMTEEHLINWILIETTNGYQLKKLKADDKPTAVFSLKDEKVLRAYAYCNLHGLWVCEL